MKTAVRISRISTSSLKSDIVQRALRIIARGAIGLSVFGIVTTRDLNTPSRVRLMTSRQVARVPRRAYRRLCSRALFDNGYNNILCIIITRRENNMLLLLLCRGRPTGGRRGLGEGYSFAE